MDTYEPKNLKRWTMPDSYAGSVWPNYFSAGFGQSRDSDALERSNFRVALEELQAAESIPGAVVVVHEGHWAVGWVEWIAIHRDDTAALKVADALKAQTDDYPVLDDDDFTELEHEDANETWANCYSVKERIDYIRAHPNQFDSFHSLADMLGCVRGKYFAGYDSEILY